jgi:ABC-2 type transport system ATP-binding protein
MNSDLMISASKLTKQFTVKKEKVNAVTDLDLEVRRGELVAFLGPNGAGKTTSLRMLTTLLPPTSGKAIVAGHNVLTESAAVRRRIGYVGQGNSGGHNQRVRDEMISQGAFYGMSRAHTIARTDELLESLDLAPLAKRAITALSGGQRRRLDIALGLVHSPELMFLDEPSTGLDPQSRANLWQHILDLRASHGTTVFVTTHYLEEADQYAERVLVMDHGRVIADDTGRALKTNLAGDVIRIGVDTDRNNGVVDVAEALSAATRVTGVPPVPVPAHPDQFELTVDTGERVLPELLRALDGAGIRVATATLRQPTLDDVFLALTGRSLREEGATAADAVPEHIDGADSPGAAASPVTPPQPLAENVSAERSSR